MAIEAFGEQRQKSEAVLEIYFPFSGFLLEVSADYAINVAICSCRNGIKVIL